MSDEVRTLKADETIGYWEYEVKNQDGVWLIECSRGEKIDPDSTVSKDAFDKFAMSLRLRLNGAELFDSTQYPSESVPFIGPYDVSPFIVEIALHTLYWWYTTSVKMYAVGEPLFRMLVKLFNRASDMEMSAEELDRWKPLSKEDMERLQFHGSSTSRLSKTLFEYGMETTTPEWRLIYLGTDTPTHNEWANQGDL